MKKLENEQILVIKKFQNFFQNLKATVIRSYIFEDEVNKEVEKKSDGTYVGSLDKNLQELWVKFLAREFPGTVVLSEEIEHDWPPKPDRFWLIDPLDGTHNEMWGFPTFGSMGVYIENGKMEMSAMYLPAEHLLAGEGMYFAFSGHGSYKIQYGVAHQIHVSESVDLSNLLLLLEGPSEWLEKNECVRHAKLIFKRKRSSASAIWAYVLLAHGGRMLPVGALITSGNKPWDNLPGCLLVEEAGGKVTDHLGNSYSLENCSSIIASNGHVHDALLKF